MAELHEILVLASQSQSRREMLAAAGVSFEAVPAQIDERALEAELVDVPAGEVAVRLAEAKALAVSAGVPGRLVLGSDSLVVCDGRRFDKPRDRGEAAAHLAWFSGKAMELHSGAALVRDGAVAWRHGERARLMVRTLSTGFIEHYLDMEWPQVGACVGVFRIEGLGVNLFEAIEGSHFTVLGMPLLAVLAALRGQGVAVA
jgi:septum formation protein